MTISIRTACNYVYTLNNVYGRLSIDIMSFVMPRALCRCPRTKGRAARVPQDRVVFRARRLVRRDRFASLAAGCSLRVTFRLTSSRFVVNCNVNLNIEISPGQSYAKTRVLADGPLRHVLSCTHLFHVCVCVLLQRPSTVIVVDEIGRMELHSQKFQQAILKLLEDPSVALFGAITAPIYGNRVPFCDRIQAHDRVQVLRLKKSTRDSVAKQYREVVLKNLIGCGLLPTPPSPAMSNTIGDKAE